MRYIRMHFEEEQRGTAVGLYMTGTKLGPAIGLPLAGYLIEAYNWQTMFLFMGFGGLVILIPWMRWVKKDDIAALPQSKREELEKQSESPDSKLQTVKTSEILASPVIWGVILGTFCYMYFVYYGMTWMPRYFGERFGMSIRDMSWFGGLAAFNVAAALLLWLGMRHSLSPINLTMPIAIIAIAGLAWAVPAWDTYLMTSGIYRQAPAYLNLVGTWRNLERVFAQYRTRYYREGYEAVVAVFERPTLTERPHLVLTIDGKVDQLRIFYSRLKGIIDVRKHLPIYVIANDQLALCIEQDEAVEQTFHRVPEQTFAPLAGLFGTDGFGNI